MMTWHSIALLLTLHGTPATQEPVQTPPLGLAGGAMVHPDRPQLAVSLDPRAWCGTQPMAPARGLSEVLADVGVPERARSFKGRPPSIFTPEGYVVIEDDGSLTRRDRAPDLEGRSVLFTPVAEGWQAVSLPASWQSDLGTPLFADQYQFHAELVTPAGFVFPFGGVDRSQFWITSDLAITFEAPQGQLGPQRMGGLALMDRTPRVAPLEQADYPVGWNAWVREDPDALLVTWQASTQFGLDLQVQVRLGDDGRVLMTWQSLRDVAHGAVTIVSATDTWWDERTVLSSATDPVGDTTMGTEAHDLTQVTMSRVSDSEVLLIDVELAAPLPADAPVFYFLRFRESATAEPAWTSRVAWTGTGWYRLNDEAAEVTPGGFRVAVLASELGAIGDTLQLTLESTVPDGTKLDSIVVDSVALDEVSISSLSPAMVDLSGLTAPTVVSEPVLEAFTAPTVLLSEVERVWNEEIGEPVDGLGVFQTFQSNLRQTTIVAFSTIGNAGVDGIGVGSSALPVTPALLHLNDLDLAFYQVDANRRTQALSHEFNHRWLHHARIEEGGVVGNILNPDGAHVAGWVHAPAENFMRCSFMGGAYWVDEGAGQFMTTEMDCTRGSEISFLERYLMGMLGPNDVPDFFYLENAVPEIPYAYVPPGQAVTADRVDVSVAQVIAAEGPRVPSVADSPKDFTVGVVILARPGDWTDDHVDAASQACRGFEAGFRWQTDRIAAVRCHGLFNEPPEPVITDPPGNVTVGVGTRVGFTGTATDANGDDVSLTWELPGGFASGPGPVFSTFNDLGDHDVLLSARDSAGLASATPAVVTVTVVDCIDPPELSGLRLGREGTDLRVTWQDLDPASDRVVLHSSVTPDSDFVERATSDASGVDGFTVPCPDDELTFYRLGARNLSNCDGPLVP